MMVVPLLYACLHVAKAVIINDKVLFLQSLADDLLVIRLIDDLVNLILFKLASRRKQQSLV